MDENKEEINRPEQKKLSPQHPSDTVVPDGDRCTIGKRFRRATA